MGIPIDEPTPKTMDDVRAAIARGQRHSKLICDSLAYANTHGMSREDTYALLAFNALLAVEKQYRAALGAVDCLAESVGLPPQR